MRDKNSDTYKNVSSYLRRPFLFRKATWRVATELLQPAIVPAKYTRLLRINIDDHRRATHCISLHVFMCWKLSNQSQLEKIENEIEEGPPKWKMRDNWPIWEQSCGNAGSTRKCVQIPPDAGHLPGLLPWHLTTDKLSLFDVFRTIRLQLSSSFLF